MYRVGIDIGWTFTDFSVLDERGGGVFNSKVLSTPADLTEGVMQALDEFFANGRLPEEVSFLFHATTVATNALLGRKGAKTWLLITEGFSGVYETPELGETRSATYDYLSYPKPPMLVRQRETIQIPERVDFRGNVLKPLDETETRRRLARLKGTGVSAFEKVPFPTTLLIMILLQLWEPLAITLLAETTVGTGILVTVAKGHRLEYFLKGLLVTPLRYAVLLFDLVTIGRFAADLWIIRNRRWRQ